METLTGARPVEVWGAAHLDTRQTLRAHMANLRRKIEPAYGERLIQTDHGVGYRFAASCSERTSRQCALAGVVDPELTRSRFPAFTNPKLSNHAEVGYEQQRLKQ